MLHNVLVWAGIGVAALAISVCFWNRKKWGNDFSRWWDAEGIVFWGIAAALLAILVVAKGCFHRL